MRRNVQSGPYLAFKVESVASLLVLSCEQCRIGRKGDVLTTKFESIVFPLEIIQGRQTPLH